MSEGGPNNTTSSTNDNSLKSSAAAGIWLPLLYLTALAAAFAAYTRWNTYQLAEKRKKNTYFPPNLSRMEYFELCDQFSPETNSGLSVLQNALLKRAAEAVRRIWIIRDEKPPLQALSSQGIVGEDLWNKLLVAEEELQQEVSEINEDSEFYQKGWKDTIFQQAGAYAQLLKQMEQEASGEGAKDNKSRKSTGKKSGGFVTSPSQASASPDSSIDSLSGLSSPIMDMPSPKSDTDVPSEKERQRLIQELIEEEEREKQKKMQQQSKSHQGGSKKKGSK